MSDLLSWLRTTIEGDKAAAEAIEDSSAPWDGQWIADGNKALRTYNQHVLAHVGGWEFKPGVLDHLARHDPRDTIARCESELTVLERVLPEVRASDVQVANEFGAGWPDDELSPTEEMLLKALAGGYRHREGFNPKWAA